MNRLKEFLNKFDLTNTLFLAGTPLLALIGTTYLIWTGGIHWQTLILALIMTIFTGVAVTAGYHRLFSHRSYDGNKFFKLFMLIFGAAAFENSARRWASDHRTHHQFVDTDKDPYNIKRGFFYAHMGWVCLKYRDAGSRYNNVADLSADPLVMWQEKYYVAIGVVAGYFMPMAVALLWGDPLGALILAGFTRMVLNHHFTFCINSFCHMLGSQPYSDENSARDSWFMALFTYGEGYHNFHHKFPSDYRNGIRFFHWDPTKWLIRGMSWFGFTKGLRRVPRHRIVLARLRMDEKRVVQEMAKVPVPHHVTTRELVASARLKFEETYVRFQRLKLEYGRLKVEKMESLSHQIHNMNDRVENLKKEISHAREALIEAMETWKQLCAQYGVRPTLAVV